MITIEWSRHISRLLHTLTIDNVIVSAVSLIFAYDIWSTQRQLNQNDREWRAITMRQKWVEIRRRESRERIAVVAAHKIRVNNNGPFVVVVATASWHSCQRSSTTIVSFSVRELYSSVVIEHSRRPFMHQKLQSFDRNSYYRATSNIDIFLFGLLDHIINANVHIVFLV